MNELRLDLERQRLVYVGGERTVAIPLDVDSLRPVLDERAVRWWDTPSGRAPVSERERVEILEAVARWAQRVDPAVSRAVGVSRERPSDAALLADIDVALAELAPLAEAGWDEAQSIVRQLRWGRAVVAGEPVETPPGPLSIGLIATREFDMYGNRPELADRVNEIQRAMGHFDS